MNVQQLWVVDGYLKDWSNIEFVIQANRLVVYYTNVTKQMNAVKKNRYKQIWLILIGWAY